MEEKTPFIKLFDLFGVMFTFRMKNYQKFRSKTGAIVTIICLLSCLLASLLDILTFFNPDKNYSEKIYYENVNGESINFVNQNFSIALSLPDIETDDPLDPFWVVEMKYKFSDKFITNEPRRNYTREEKVNEKPCNLSDVINTDIADTVKNLNLKCFQFDSSQMIMGDYYAKNYSYFELKLLTKKKFNNKIRYFDKDEVFFQIFYPQNNLKNPNDYSVLDPSLSNIRTQFYYDSKLRQNFFLKKNVYTEDNGIVFTNKHEYTYIGFDREEKEIYHLNSKENIDDKVELGKIFFREGSTTKRYDKSCTKLLALLKSILTSLVNILLGSRFIMEFINLLKAKKNVIETCVFVDKGDDTHHHRRNSQMQNIQNMNKNNNKKVSFMENKDEEKYSNSKTNQNFTKKSSMFTIEEQVDEEDDKNNKKTINAIELNEIIKFSDQTTIQKEKNLISSEDWSKEDSNNNKNLNEKMINEENKHSFKEEEEVNEDNDNKGNDNIPDNFIRSKSRKSIISGRMNLKTWIWSIVCCKFKKSDNISKLFKYTIDKFNNYLYIVEYIRKMEEIESLKKYLFDKTEDMTIFERLSIPKLKIRYDEIVHENLFQLTESDKGNSHLYEYLNNYEYKENKTKTEKKFIRMIEDYVNYLFN